MTPAAPITQLYIGYFDRAPDPAGLAYWTDLVAKGQSIPAIAGYFAQQPEFKAIYGDPALGTFEPMNFVIKVYENLFGRMPEPEGLAYWTTQLASGAVAPGQLVATVQYVANSAGAGVDFQALANKVEAATYFLDKMAAANLGWSLDPARTVIDKVGSSPTSLADAKKAIETYIDHVLHPDTGPGNSAPVAVDDTVRTDTNHSILIDVLANDTDADGNTLSIVADSIAATHGTAVIEAGKIRFTPDAGYHGTASITYKASDGSAQSNAAAVTISVNTLPVATNDDTIYAIPDWESGYSFNATNSHYYKFYDLWSYYTFFSSYFQSSSGYIVTITSEQENTFVTSLLPAGKAAWLGLRDTNYSGIWKIDGGADGEHGTIIWPSHLSAPGQYANWQQNPNSVFGETWAILRSDGTWKNDYGYSPSMAVGFMLELGGRPQDLLKISQDAVRDLPTELVLANDTDADGDTLSVISVATISAKGATVTLSGTTITYNGRAVSELIALPGGATTTDTITYTISDGHGGTATATAQFTVVGVNDAATIGGDSAGSVKEGALSTATPSQIATGQLTVTDPDTGEATFQPLTDLQGFYGKLSLTTAGAWTYTLDAGGRVETLADGQTTSDIFTIASADGTTQLITISVEGTNDAPVAVDDILTGARLLPEGFARFDGNGHYYTIVTTPIPAGNASSAAAAVNGGYLATITKAAEGGFIASLLPTLNDIAWFSASDNAQEGTWIITDGPEAGLQFWQGLTPQQGGYATGGAFANWRLGEPNNSVGSENFAFIQSNSEWADFPSSAIPGGMFGYVVEIGGRPQDALKISNGQSLQFSAASLLNNDRDVDNGDTISVTAVGGTTASGTSANGAAVTLASGVITYDPSGSSALQALAAGATMTDSFTYTIKDSHGVTAQATVSFTVVGGTAPIVSGALGLSVAENDVAVQVGSFTLADADSASGLQMQVLRQIANGVMIDGRFEVKPANGTTSGAPGTYEVWLKSGKSLDYEAASSIALTIETFDSTGLVGSGSLTVTVTDVVEP